ncbi:hypothetical protein [Rugamonas rivuli]|nr:hypothetical protein [Rugamonas rivuli]
MSEGRAAWHLQGLPHQRNRDFYRAHAPHGHQSQPAPCCADRLAWHFSGWKWMDDLIRGEILSLARTAHGLTELSYQNDPARRGESGWNEKQRVLLADMALHLLQTSLGRGELSEADLKRNLFSILTISDQLMPDHGLKAVAEELYSS